MPVYFLSFLLFGGTAAHAAAPAVSNEEIEEIKSFAALTHDIGHLLSPPRGSVDPEVLAARDYIQELVEELAGPELKSLDVHYVVNIYGSDVNNAWVRQINPIDKGSSEGKWKERFPNSLWPLRKAWGFPDDGTPIYELGITVTPA
jgi:hypothetical protein